MIKGLQSYGFIKQAWLRGKLQVWVYADAGKQRKGYPYYAGLEARWMTVIIEKERTLHLAGDCHIGRRREMRRLWTLVFSNGLFDFT